MAKVYQKKDGSFVIINDFHEEIPVPDIDKLFPFHNEVATFRVMTKQGPKYGYINLFGERITKNVYDHAEDFGINYGIVKNGKLQNVIDRKGNELFGWKYTKIDIFLKNTFIVKNKAGYYGLVDINDKVILAFIYDDIISVTFNAKRILSKWPTPVGHFCWQNYYEVLL